MTGDLEREDDIRRAAADVPEGLVLGIAYCTADGPTEPPHAPCRSCGTPGCARHPVMECVDFCPDMGEGDE